MWPKGPYRALDKHSSPMSYTPVARESHTSVQIKWVILMRLQARGVRYLYDRNVVVIRKDAAAELHPCLEPKAP